MNWMAGGPAPARADIENDGVPDGYRAMNAREAIKVMVG
jgi:hypothetical protein